MALLERNELVELVDEMHTVAEVRRYKSHPAVDELRAHDLVEAARIAIRP